MYPLGGRSHRCTRDFTEGSRIAHVPYIFDAGLVRGEGTLAGCLAAPFPPVPW